MLSEAERRSRTRAARIGQTHQLERRYHGRLQRRDTIYALAQIEREVELCLTNSLHPSRVGIDRNPDGLVSVLGKYPFYCLDRFEDQHIGGFAERRRAIEENRDFHAAAPLFAEEIKGTL